MTADIRLVCLDFDGTIMAYEEETSFFHPVALDLLNRMEAEGVEWCTNSGRSVGDQVQIIERSRARGLRHLPAAVLSGEALIFERRDGTYQPSEPWHTSTTNLLRDFHGRVQRTLDPHLPGWAERFAPEVRVGRDYTVFLVQDVEGRAAAFLAEVEEAVRPVPRAMVTRNGGWLVILPDELGKGNVLKAYLGRRGLGAEHALAVGDHLNDVNMLDGRAARHVGCPADAVPDVIQTVRASGGYVARSGGPEGTAEVICHFLPGLA